MPKNSFVLVLLFCLYTSDIWATNQELSDTTEAYNYLLKANALKKDNLIDSSNFYLEKAAHEFSQNGYWNRFFECHYHAGYNLSSFGRHQDALDYFLPIEKEYSSHLDPLRASTFSFYWQIGWAYFQLYEHTQALDYYNKAAVAMELCEDPVKPGQWIKIIYDKGVIFTRLDQYDQALKFMEEVLKKGDEVDMHFYDAYALNNLGIIYKKLGEYRRSLDFYERAFEMAERNYRSNGYNLAGLCPFYVNFSSLYSELGLLEESAENVKTGLKLYHENADGWWPVYYILKYNEIENSLKQQDYDNALMTCRETLKIIEENFGLITQTSGILMYLGKVYYKKQLYDSSEFYYRKYFEFTEGDPSFREGNSIAHKDLSQLYWDLSYSDKALEEVQTGLILMSEGFESRSLEDNPDPENVFINYRLLLDLLSTKTEYLMKLDEEEEFEDYLNLAFGANQAARDIASRIRKNLYYKSSKIALAEFSQKIFEQGIVINERLYRRTNDEKYLDELLNCFEGNRANLLAEAFQVSKAYGFTNLPDSIINKEIMIYNRIAEREAGIISVRDSSEVAYLKNELFDLKTEYEDILKVKSGFHQNFDNDNPLLTKEIQDQLSGKELILEYFAGEENYHLLAISKKSAKYFNLGPVDSVDSLVSEFVDLIKDPDSENFGYIGYRLFSRILSPALEDLNVSVLVTIPDGSLSYLPFEALSTRNDSKLRVEDYLISSFQTRSHYSCSLFMTLKGWNNKPDLKSYIGFAPDFDKESNPLLAIRSSGDTELSNSLEKLPGAALEVRTAAGFFDGEAVIGSGATESYFKKNAAGYQLIHLASHTLVNTEDPLYSRLIFASEDQGSEDGLLYLYELYGMQLNSTLVTLSACNTGVGKAYKGEGMMSLGRGFMGAGARNVLMTLWSVSDLSSSGIMSSFFQKLKNGMTEPDALRSAKLEYLRGSDEITSHPYYWSGYVFIGNGTLKSNNYINWIIGLMILAIGYLVLRRIRASS